MSSLRNAIKLLRTGHGTAALRGPLLRIAFTILLSGPILGFVARSLQLKYRSGTPVNRYEVQSWICMTVTFGIITWGLTRLRKLAIVEAASIARAK